MRRLADAQQHQQAGSGGHRLRFLTLTTRSPVGRGIGGLWNHFRTLCKRAGIPIEGVRVFELHKFDDLGRGHGMHAHAVLTRYVAIQLVRRLARRAGFGRVHIEVIPTHAAVRYLSKYVSKQLSPTKDREGFETLKQARLPWLKGMRLWACVGLRRNWPRPCWAVRVMDCTRRSGYGEFVRWVLRSPTEAVAVWRQHYGEPPMWIFDVGSPWKIFPDLMAWWTRFGVELSQRLRTTFAAVACQPDGDQSGPCGGWWCGGQWSADFPASRLTPAGFDWVDPTTVVRRVSISPFPLCPL